MGRGVVKRVRITGAAAAAAALVACGGGPGGVSPEEWPVPDRRAACFELRYGGEAAAAQFPRMLVIDRGGRSGRAFWFPAARSDTAWREFYARGHWSREGRGRLRVTFDAGDQKIQLDLEQQGDGSVIGRATRRDAAERSATLEGRHVSCPRPPTPDSAG